MSSNFACQACGFETGLVQRAERHEFNKEGHEVFEFFQPTTTPPADLARGTNDEETR